VPESIKEEKRAFRKALRRRIAALTEKELEKSDAGIYNNLSSLPELLEAETVFLYCSTGHEVDTRRLIAFLLDRGQTVALPVSLPDGEMYFAEYRPGRLQEGRFFGIPEPGKDARRLEPEDGGLIVVPALCFDREGYRMGQGGGYYDRYLSARDLFSVGVGRDMLLCDRVIREEHDRPVDCLVTESGVYRFAGKEKTGE
jgi:5-formyltetrahydrofolate cyclo-ligase